MRWLACSAVFVVAMMMASSVMMSPLNNEEPDGMHQNSSDRQDDGIAEDTVLGDSLPPELRASGGSILYVGEGQDYIRIQDAVNNATNGSIIRIFAGLYHENVIVDKSLTLLGNGSSKTRLSSNSGLITLWITADHCSIDGLGIVNASSQPSVGGISFSCRNSIVQNCTIAGNASWAGVNFHGSNNTLQNCTINGNNHGISVGRAYGVRIVDCVVYGNSHNGIEIVFSSDILIDGCDVFNNYGSGIWITRSFGCEILDTRTMDNVYYGIIIVDSSYVTMKGTIVDSNGFHGLGVAGGEGPSEYITIQDSVIAGNGMNGMTWYGFGGLFFNGSICHSRVIRNRICDNYGYGIELLHSVNDTLIYNNDFINNSNGLPPGTPQATDGFYLNSWDNGTVGNFWNDWTAPDINGDGIVDQPYYLNATTGCRDNYPSTSEFNLHPDIGDSIRELITLVESMDLSKGTTNSLTSKLQNALKSLEKGNDGAATNQISAFISEVGALAGKKLTMVQADMLLKNANRVLGML